MEALCCSDKCEKRFECARADINNEGTHCVENWYSFGTGTMTENGCQIDHWCGKLGNYKMFEPMEVKIEDVVVRDFSTNEYTFNGRNLNLDISDEEIERIADKMDRVNLISPEELRKILKIHRIKT